MLIFTLLGAMGFGCILAAVDARYRDVRHALPLLIQVCPHAPDCFAASRMR